MKTHNLKPYIILWIFFALLIISVIIYYVGVGSKIPIETQEHFGFYDLHITAKQGQTYMHPQVLGAMIEKEVTTTQLIDEIIFCESSGNPEAKNPKSTAYGLCQFLDGTWEYVKTKWNIELDRHDPGDQLYACKRLLEEEGLKHWKPIWDCINYEE